MATRGIKVVYKDLIISTIVDLVGSSVKLFVYKDLIISTIVDIVSLTRLVTVYKDLIISTIVDKGNRVKIFR